MRVNGGMVTPEVVIEEDNNVVIEEDLMRLLDKLGFTASQRTRALAEDHERVMAWLERAQEPDVLNPAGLRVEWDQGGRLADCEGQRGSRITRHQRPARR